MIMNEVVKDKDNSRLPNIAAKCKIRLILRLWKICEQKRRNLRILLVGVFFLISICFLKRWMIFFILSLLEFTIKTLCYCYSRYSNHFHCLLFISRWGPGFSEICILVLLQFLCWLYLQRCVWNLFNSSHHTHERKAVCLQCERCISCDKGMLD